VTNWWMEPEFRKLVVLREDLADVQHQIWAHWMKYLYSVSQEYPDGSMMIPANKAERWYRQMHTDFADLTIKEQMSDFEQADKVIKVVVGSQKESA